MNITDKRDFCTIGRIDFRAPNFKFSQGGLEPLLFRRRPKGVGMIVNCSLLCFISLHTFPLDIFQSSAQVEYDLFRTILLLSLYLDLSLIVFLEEAKRLSLSTFYQPNPANETVINLYTYRYVLNEDFWDIVLESTSNSSRTLVVLLVLIYGEKLLERALIEILEKKKKKMRATFYSVRFFPSNSSWKKTSSVKKVNKKSRVS